MSEQSAVTEDIPMAQSGETTSSGDTSAVAVDQVPAEEHTGKGEQHENIAFDTEEPATLPPLTYIDFIPQCLGSAIEGKEPDFAEFG